MNQDDRLSKNLNYTKTANEIANKILTACKSKESLFSKETQDRVLGGMER